MECNLTIVGGPKTNNITQTHLLIFFQISTYNYRFTETDLNVCIQRSFIYVVIEQKTSDNTFSLHYFYPCMYKRHYIYCCYN